MFNHCNGFALLLDVGSSCSSKMLHHEHTIDGVAEVESCHVGGRLAIFESLR